MPTGGSGNPVTLYRYAAMFKITDNTPRVAHPQLRRYVRYITRYSIEQQII